MKRIPAWVWLSLIAIAPRLVNLGQENLWYDESFTAWMVKLDLGSMWRAIQGDVHPPLWYVIEWINTRLLGNSEFALRWPAFVFGVIGVILIWQIALQLNFSRRTAFVAGLLAAFLPGAIYYSQDARFYPLLACCVLLAVWAALSQRWVIFALACAGTVYTQNLGVFYVFALGLAVIVTRPSWRDMIAPASALAGVILIWLPWAWILAHQAGLVAQGFWIQPITLGGALFPLAEMTMGWRVGEVFQIHIYAVAIAITIIGLIVSRRWLRSRSGLVLIAAIFGAPVLIALVSALWHSIYLPRALLPSAMMIVLLWAYALQHLSKQNRRAALAIFVPAMAVAVIAHYFPAAGREDLKSWLTPVNADWQPGDVVYHTAVHTAISFGYYLPGKAYEIRPAVGDLNQSLTDETKAAMHFLQGDFDHLAFEGYKRAWLLVYTNPMSKQDEFDEIARITRDYPSELIQARRTDFAQELIYLVTLDERPDF